MSVTLYGCWEAEHGCSLLQKLCHAPYADVERAEDAESLCLTLKSCADVERAEDVASLCLAQQSCADVERAERHRKCADVKRAADFKYSFKSLFR